MGQWRASQQKKMPYDRFGVKVRKSQSEHFSAAVPQKADVVLHRGERQVRAGLGHSLDRPM